MKKRVVSIERSMKSCRKGKGKRNQRDSRDDRDDNNRRIVKSIRSSSSIFKFVQLILLFSLIVCFFINIILSVSDDDDKDVNDPRQTFQ